ncbi:hypothetical protein OPIT5_00425 (plasmid) [Opitutaceae bacterium TAV5]|nr:hypothetical protein OPIT5_00425 [Opitutaceae bacterium TAV5]
MLKIRVIRDVASRVAYHTTGKGLTDAEKRGIWAGDGSRLAGYTDVTAESLAAALTGYDMQGSYLGQRRKPNRRAGWDVVLSPHKSISVAILCLPPRIAQKVRRAWDSAVAATISSMESLACRTDGNSVAATGNLIVACYTHERSRRDDPHVHTHCIVMNATLDAGAGWRGLEPAPIFRNNMNLDGVLQHELRRQLEIEGIPVSLDPKGRARLPMPEYIISRLSASKRAIDDAIGNQEERTPDSLSSIHSVPTLRNLLNDRLRPPKRMPARRPAQMLRPDERKALTRSLSPGKPPSPPLSPSSRDIAKAATSLYHRVTLWPVAKRLFACLVTVARSLPRVPFASVLRALPFIPHPPSLSGTFAPPLLLAEIHSRRRVARPVPSQVLSVIAAKRKRVKKTSIRQTARHQWQRSRAAGQTTVAAPGAQPAATPAARPPSGRKSSML